MTATTQNKLSEARSRLRSLYESDTRPWVVAYSGGKDSTAVLQLVYELLLEEKQLGAASKPVFVISSDTRVEAPNVATYVSSALELIAAGAEQSGLSLEVELVTPTAREGFWAKLIGLGYPSPTRWFRWCTTSMKIKPSRRAIEQISQQHGSVILLLGTRIDESVSRGNAINARETNARGLNPHNEIPNALVATPIVDWSTDDVWDYLYSNNPPWGGDHSFMLSLYRQANGGECPLILDLNTPSCGGSRFGCWTCTVVKEDKSMQGFIQSGEEWMKPLNDFRDWLKEIREDQTRRNPLRRDGKSSGPGPFNAVTRKEILARLFDAERIVKQVLISDDELAVIQDIWTDEFDYSDTVFKLAATYGRGGGMGKPEAAQSDENTLLAQCARDLEFGEELASELFETVRKKHAMLDRWGAKEELRRELRSLIERDINQALAADPAHDL